MVEKLFHKCDCGKGCFIELPNLINKNEVMALIESVYNKYVVPDTQERVLNQAIQYQLNGLDDLQKHTILFAEEL